MKPRYDEISYEARKLLEKAATLENVPRKLRPVQQDLFVERSRDPIAFHASSFRGASREVEFEGLSSGEETSQTNGEK